MTWRVSSKWFDGTSTNVILIGEEDKRNFNLTARVEGHHINKDDSDLISMALEDVFKTIFVQRAMPEAIKKVDEYTVKIEEMKGVINEANKVLENVKKESRMTQEALMEITELVTTIMAGGLGEDGIPVGGDISTLSPVEHPESEATTSPPSEVPPVANIDGTPLNRG